MLSVLWIRLSRFVTEQNICAGYHKIVKNVRRFSQLPPFMTLCLNRVSQVQVARPVELGIVRVGTIARPVDTARPAEVVLAPLAEVGSVHPADIVRVVEAESVHPADIVRVVKKEQYFWAFLVF